MDARDPNLAAHLSPEDIAVLAEGPSRERVPQHLLEHLSRCRSCMAAYADVVRYRAGWLAFPEVFEDPRSRAGGKEFDARTTRARRRPTLARIPVAAGLVVVFGLTAIWWAVRVRPRPVVDPITVLLERASAEGLVIPGGETGAAGRPRAYRSGGSVDDDAVRELERLRADHERKPPRQEDVHRLAAGLLASGHVDLAGDYVAEGLARAPADPRLLTLAAILAHRGGDPQEAERRLREALRASPGDLTAQLDLGLLLAESRRTEEAAALLSEVLLRAPGSPLAARAQRVLATHRRP